MDPELVSGIVTFGLSIFVLGLVTGLQVSYYVERKLKELDEKSKKPRQKSGYEGTGD